MEVKNILSDLPNIVAEEIFETLLDRNNIKIERIISFGQSSPEGYWYNQELNEWVVLLSGSATILFDGDEKEILLKPGDYIFIPAKVKHRISWTDRNQKSVWLAIFFN